MRQKLNQIGELAANSRKIKRLKTMVPEAKKFFVIGQSVRVIAVVSQIAAFAIPFHMLSMPIFASDFVGIVWVGLASGILLFLAASLNLLARRTIARARVIFELKFDSWVVSARNSLIAASEGENIPVSPRGRPLSRLLEKRYVAGIALITSSILLAIVFFWRVEIGLTYLLTVLILALPFLNIVRRSANSSYSLSSPRKLPADDNQNSHENTHNWDSTPIFERLTLTQQTQFLVSTFTTVAFVGALLTIAIGINWSASAPISDVVTLILLARALSEQIDKGLSEYASSMFFVRELEDFHVFEQKSVS